MNDGNLEIDKFFVQINRFVISINNNNLQRLE